MLQTLARARRIGGQTGHAALLVFFVTFLAFPFYWMLLTTFKTTQDLHNTANDPYLFNDPPTLHHLQVLQRFLSLRLDVDNHLQWHKSAEVLFEEF